MSGASRNVKKQIAIGRSPGHLWHGPLYLPTQRVKLGMVLPGKSKSTSLCIIRLLSVLMPDGMLIRPSFGRAGLFFSENPRATGPAYGCWTELGSVRGPRIRSVSGGASHAKKQAAHRMHA